MTSVPERAPSSASLCATSCVDVVSRSSSTRGRPSSPASSVAEYPSRQCSSATRVKDHQHDNAEQHAIQCKNSVAVTRHVPQQNCYREPAADCGRQHADDQRRAESCCAQHLGTFQYNSRRDDGHAHEKTEYRRALTIEAQQAASTDRRS